VEHETTTADPLAEFEAARSTMFGVAYRMTSSAADADDLVQEAWLRWRRVDHAAVDHPTAFLVRTVSRLALDRLASSQRRREHYVGVWLPEPLVDADDDDPPATAAELSDSLTFSFLLLLDELSPHERATFLLHDVFGFSFDEVATAMQRTPESCRQLASRARRELAERRPRVESVDRPRQREVVTDMLTALAAGDVQTCISLLAPDVVYISDGGADRRAARRAVVGQHRVSRFLINVSRRIAHDPSMSIESVKVNGHPGLLIRSSGRPDVVHSFEFAPDGRLRRVYSQMNPDKLGHLVVSPLPRIGS
jgi:RNA polymerase sigma-70 factor, ECF subfamily